MTRIHQSVPRGASQGALVRIPAHVHHSQPRIPLCNAVLGLLGGRTARAVATSAGLGASSLSRFLRGLHDIRGANLLAVSKVLGCTMEELLEAVSQGADREKQVKDTREFLGRVRRGRIE